MAGIGGIGSGLDIESIVTALVGAERAPKESQLARLEKATTTKFSALGTLKGALSNLQTALKSLNDSALFETRSASSSIATSVSASAGKLALAGSYQIGVTRLASSSKVATAAVDNSFTSGASAETLTVKLGASDTGTVVNIAAGANLSAVRDSLNTALKDKGITVNLVSNPSSPTGESRLVFSSTKTGAGLDISVTGSGGLSGLNIDGSAALVPTTPGSSGYITQAQDAEFTVDGLVLNSPTNSITGAIPDVTLTLTAKTEAGKDATLTVGRDNAGVKGNVKKLVDAYNKLVTTSNELTSVTQVGDGKAPVLGGLVGDASVRGLMSGVRNELVNAVGEGGVRMLTDLGITTQRDGTLKIDDAKFDKALADNYDDVGKFFTGDTGLTTRLSGRVDGYVASGGTLELRMNALQSTLKNVDKQRETLDLRTTQLQARLFKQFNTMDSLVARLNQTSQSLGQSLSGLPGVVSN